MNSKFFFIFVILSILAGVFAGRMIATPLKASNLSSASNVQVTPKVVIVTSTPTPTPIARPRELIVPALGIDTNIEIVGQDESGRMDVPKNAWNVAWYEYGPKPGEKGNSVIAGHLDNVDGSPAVFYNLRSLAAGNIVMVVYEDGTRKNFQVTEINSYSDSDFPLEKVFGDSPDARLNLITCNGYWNSSIHSYSERLVITAIPL